MEITYYINEILGSYDSISSQEMRKKAFCFGTMIEENDLAARQIYMCLLQLADVMEQ